MLKARDNLNALAQFIPDEKKSCGKAKKAAANKIVGSNAKSKLKNKIFQKTSLSYRPYCRHESSIGPSTVVLIHVKDLVRKT